MVGACLTAATIITGGTPAAADAEDCPKGDVCIWGDSNFEGQYVFTPQTTRSDVGDYMRDKVTSIWNRSDRQIYLWTEQGFTGRLMGYLPPGEWVANFSSSNNDRLSSWCTRLKCNE
ncbi:peptidase inhibitor family I36 protein [Streptomyces ureilyticus]